MNSALIALLEGSGSSEVTARNVSQLISRLDPTKLAFALNHNASDETEKARFQFIDVWDLLRLKPQEWLVPGVLPRSALAVLVAPPERYKTFLGLDLALTIATGMGTWLGRFGAACGPVVYVSAEGSGGLLKRVQAWVDYNGREPDNIHFITEAVPLLEDTTTDIFIRELQAAVTDPALILFDTVARCMLGGDENSAQDVGHWIANADRVKEATGATVFGIHHTNAGGEKERGSTALRGACDTMLRIKGERDEPVLVCEKMKDDEHFRDVPIQFRQHMSSGVVTARIGDAVSRDEVTPKQLEVLKSLHACSEPNGLTASKWFAVSEQKEKTFYTARKALHDNGFVTLDKVGRGGLYTVTSKGEQAITASLPFTSLVTACSDGTHCMPGTPSFRGVPARCSSGRK